MDTDDQKALNANNLIQEKFPIDPAPDEENIDVNVLPTFYNSKFRKSKPTKKMTKVSKDFKGQQKISYFFSSTKADIKPKPNAPTQLDIQLYEVENTESDTDNDVCQMISIIDSDK